MHAVESMSCPSLEAKNYLWVCVIEVGEVYADFLLTIVLFHETGLDIHFK